MPAEDNAYPRHWLSHAHCVPWQAAHAAWATPLACAPGASKTVPLTRQRGNVQEHGVSPRALDRSWSMGSVMAHGTPDRLLLWRLHIGSFGIQIGPSTKRAATKGADRLLLWKVQIGSFCRSSQSFFQSRRGSRSAPFVEAPDRLFFVEAPQKERVGPALPQLARDGYAWLARKQVTSAQMLATTAYLAL